MQPAEPRNVRACCALMPCDEDRLVSSCSFRGACLRRSAFIHSDQSNNPSNDSHPFIICEHVIHVYVPWCGERLWSVLFRFWRISLNKKRLGSIRISIVCESVLLNVFHREGQPYCAHTGVFCAKASRCSVPALQCDGDAAVHCETLIYVFLKIINDFMSLHGPWMLFLCVFFTKNVAVSMHTGRICNQTKIFGFECVCVVRAHGRV